MFTFYSFRNIYTNISEYYFQNHYMLIGKYILITSTAFWSQEILGVHAQLSKCWRGTWL